jgi:hypothetical protein
MWMIAVGIVRTVIGIGIVRTMIAVGIRVAALFELRDD